MMAVTIDADVHSIDLDKIGRLDRKEIDEYTPTRKLRVINKATNQQREFTLKRVIREGYPRSQRFQAETDEGRFLHLMLYTLGAVQVKVLLDNDLA